ISIEKMHDGRMRVQVAIPDMSLSQHGQFRRAKRRKSQHTEMHSKKRESRIRGEGVFRVGVDSLAKVYTFMVSKDGTVTSSDPILGLVNLKHAVIAGRSSKELPARTRRKLRELCHRCEIKRDEELIQTLIHLVSDV